ncbi:MULTISPECIES: Ldh family oxidoreductase [Streptomyces]|uniref:Ldh family oxidoreductase n=1 Tax=Streptomyces TaxID=1883 RepID=UPI001F5F1EE1|nr:Ldh family oxidoreductase [Streptomyces kasugaensis]
MRVAIEELRALMAAVCHAARVPEQETALVVEHYLVGELRGKTSHGVAKFCFESRFFHERQSPPEVVRERGVFAVIDAHREIGPLSAAFAVRIALDRAARYGAGFVGLINTQRYGILATWSEEIARHGLLGIAANTSRAEAAVAGGRTPVLGVNPLAFALPTLDEPLSADLSTTLAPMGVLWESRRAGQPLPAGCFVDADGRPTEDPDRAVSAVVFGEHRGFAISLLLQALTGSLFGFPMGSDVADTWTTGYTFIALDPAFANPDGLAAANSRLVEQLHAARDADGGTLRVPGENGRARAVDTLAAGTVEVPEQVLRRLRARADGDFTSD